MKAVIPAAGLGIRFLPLTKSQPKEMLPVVNKPTIQWVVEEAVGAGITDIAIITNRNKKALNNYFLPSSELEEFLAKAGKFKELDVIRRVNNLANFEFIVQEKQKGLAHAVYCAKEFVDNNPFVVLLGDTICSDELNCTKSLIDLYNEGKKSIISVIQVDRKETKNYGIVSGNIISDELMHVTNLVEKPEPHNSPSCLAILGRYLLEPKIFDYISESKSGHGGELQLTDALQLYANENELYSLKFTGKRYDIGNVRDWLISNIELGKKYLGEV